MSGGKRRIYQYFTETPARSMTEKANFLKDEYGIGGRSPAVSGADGSNEAHDSKGIVLQKKRLRACQNAVDEGGGAH